ncbi:MAG: chromosomal replication initiator protein DnaA [Rickettsiales bacterium]
MMAKAGEHDVCQDGGAGVWSKSLQCLESEFGQAVSQSWFAKINFEKYENNVVHLVVPTRFVRDWISTHYEKKILKVWKTFDQSVRKICFSIASKADNVGSNSQRINYNKSISDPSVFENKPISNVDVLGSKLDQRFTFENFVVGKPNQLAYAAARSVAESAKVMPGSNPLFLYGGVGLGKTHLMHAVAWYIKRNTPERKVVYISAEKFMYQFIRSLRSKDIMSFKESFRSVDVLMVDDVQFICGKEGTQEEFFHTLNTLIDNNKQIIISCDRSPSDLENMEERIKSRLGWGLVADVHNTTYELRVGILESKIANIGIEIPKPVIEFLAARITSNIRELEGALNKVIAHSNLIGRQITLEATQEILRDLLRSNEKNVTIEQIQKKVAERYNVKVSDLSSARRARSIARPRQIAMYLSKQHTHKSLTEIGKKFGGKDHTTVMHAVKKVEKLMDEDSDFTEDIKLLRKVLEC